MCCIEHSFCDYLTFVSQHPRVHWPVVMQSEVRKRQIIEKKSHSQLLALRKDVADKSERIRKLEQEMIEIQRINPPRTRQWLALNEGMRTDTALGVNS